jgi:hypothetical protein
MVQSVRATPERDNEVSSGPQKANTAVNPKQPRQSKQTTQTKVTITGDKFNSYKTKIV